MDPQNSGLGPNLSNADGSVGSPPNVNGQKRQRAKQACEPCRLRKRRCDGNTPCNMCTQFEYKCYFEKHSRKRSKIVENNEAVHDGHSQGKVSSPEESRGGADAEFARTAEPSHEDRSSLEDASKIRSMEANSGIAFTRLLGLRLDPSSGPKLFTFGWNLGSGNYILPKTQPITDLLAHDQMYALASSYFENVHPLYGFLDKAWVLEQLNLRWVRPEVCQIPDHMLAGIAAVGILFSDSKLDHVLPLIVDSAKLVLESTSTMQPPCLMDVQSWLLRVLYLRSSNHPHAVWIATCTTMHLIESIGIHQEANSSVLHPSANSHLYNKEIRRRVFWIARMLNTWVSFEYGRARVALRGITCQLPTPTEGDFTTDFINLYSLSCALDPERINQAGQWEDFLRQLESYKVPHDGIELSKANLGLCGYRRIRLANPTLSTETMNHIISMGLKGLDAARRMAARGMPWWHVANVPFQVICIFLAMDVRESLAHIATAMRTLEEVVERFNTVAMKEALKTARFLIRLSKKRKDEDADVLRQSLKRGTAEDPHPENLQQSIVPTTTVNTRLPMIPPSEAPMTALSNEDWNMDILQDANFDWNYFLTADMPAFNSFAPDGAM